jgi:L-arabinokinase
MDQMTAVFGEEDRLLALLCQPAEIQGNVEIPRGLAFWGIDSGIAHQVSGADYGSVRVGAFMGYRMLKECAGTDWGGYLANLTPSELEQKYLERLPETMGGREFLERFGNTADGATTVEPERVYPVRRPTAHPVYEHFRVRAFVRLLESDAAFSAPVLGELMYQSHASYSACGLGSEGTDRLVELARGFGLSRGIYGAKITGGGSGGTVAILGRRDADASVREIARQYARETGLSPHVFSGSSAGALKESTRPSPPAPDSPS